MLRKTISLLVFASFVLGVFASPVLAGHRIQDNKEGTVSLESTGNHGNNDVPEQASGVAKFKLDPLPEGDARMTVELTVNNLPERAGRLYEVWLTNNTGTSLNLTAFNTNSNGNAKTTVSRHIVNVAPYDRIVVTRKRRSSFNTSRGSTILSGRLH